MKIVKHIFCLLVALVLISCWESKNEVPINWTDKQVTRLRGTKLINPLSFCDRDTCLLVISSLNNEDTLLSFGYNPNRIRFLKVEEYNENNILLSAQFKDQDKEVFLSNNELKLRDVIFFKVNNNSIKKVNVVSDSVLLEEITKEEPNTDSKNWYHLPTYEHFLVRLSGRNELLVYQPRYTLEKFNNESIVKVKKAINSKKYHFSNDSILYFNNYSGSISLGDSLALYWRYFVKSNNQSLKPDSAILGLFNNSDKSLFKRLMSKDYINEGAYYPLSCWFYKSNIHLISFTEWPLEYSEFKSENDVYFLDKRNWLLKRVRNPENHCTTAREIDSLGLDVISGGYIGNRPLVLIDRDYDFFTCEDLIIVKRNRL